jgi:rifampin ADP-ribosylating transferase
MDDDSAHIPVTFEHYDHVSGPFYHGTKADVEPGDLLVPGHGSNFEDGRVSNNIYFTGTLDAAIWGAELARGEGAGRVYTVEPTGPFEDDPNLTNKRFPGNPTRSYRTRKPLRVVSEVKDWQGHPPDVLQAMRDHLAEMERQGLATIDD